MKKHTARWKTVYSGAVLNVFVVVELLLTTERSRITFVLLLALMTNVRSHWSKFNWVSNRTGTLTLENSHTQTHRLISLCETKIYENKHSPWQPLLLWSEQQMTKKMKRQRVRRIRSSSPSWSDRSWTHPSLWVFVFRWFGCVNVLSYDRSKVQ